VIMITYLSEVKLAVKAMKLGAYDYLTKPFSLDNINKLVSNALEYSKIKKKLKDTPQEEGTTLIGKSKQIEIIRNTVKKIGAMDYDTCILLQGESGVGKEVVAKLIHKLKFKDNNAYVAINCASIPKTLQESELFGYEKGAFSGAQTNKIGLIERADKGLLFLDEIADMDLKLQAKMLRVLQEKKFRSVGGLEEKTFQATIVVASNKDLKQEIMNGNFREDLYYRLNIIPINIPPLRDRREDIPILVSRFIKIYNEKLNKEVASIGDDVLNMFIQYNWPGNIRELRNIIVRIMIFKEGSTIEIDDLPAEILDYIDVKDETQDSYALEVVEKETIKKSLDKNNWNISLSAAELGISRLTLRRKIEKFDLKK
ncbi:MAG: sigma-54 dependent transcriptional regulator, partial [Clostridia bacterium]|nr:sigma-54 dependent transcriptional regulator [Clostridia bacterium]